MPSLNGVSAWIEVDGQEIENYGAEEDQGRITCWIPAQANKNFSVSFRDDTPYRDHSLCSSVSVDGLFVGGKVLYPQPIAKQYPSHFMKARTAIQKEQVISATSSRPFMFSKIELTDEDEYLHQTSTHLGEIRVDVYRAQTSGRYLISSTSVSEGYSKIHERSKKAVTHCVSFGKKVETAPAYTCDIRRLDNDVLVTFIFKYRDSGLLQANGIIPKPLAANRREVLDLTIDNDVKPKPIVQKTHTRKGSKRSNSNLEGGLRPAKKIKREKNVAFNGEVIDLT